MENILQSFIQQKAKRPILTTSLQNSEVRIDYTKLEEKSDAFAALLKDAGCREGDHICCMTEKISSAFISMMGIMKAGCICVPVNPRYSREQMSAIIYETDSRWFLADESVSPLPDPLLFETGEISLGWLGEAQEIPEGMVPEFVSENIDQYSGRSVFSDNRARQPDFRFVLPDSKNHFKELHVDPTDIATLVSQYGDVFSGRFSDRVASFFPDHLLRFFWELQGSAKQEDQFYLLGKSLLEQPDKLASFLHTRQITRLFVQADEVNRLASGQTKKAVSSRTVKEVAIWGKLPPLQNIADLKEVFPKCDVKNCFKGSMRNEHFSVPEDGKAKIQTPIFQNKRNAIPEQKEEFIFGFAEESTLVRFKNVGFIHDMKDGYLNFWRKIEEENCGRLELR